MSMERMRFQEPGMPQTEFAGGKSTGCYLSSVSVGLLALLAVVLAIGVGVVVYFAASAATLQCQCLMSSDNGPQVSDLAATPAPDQLWDTCINMSLARNECKYFVLYFIDLLCTKSLAETEGSSKFQYCHHLCLATSKTISGAHNVDRPVIMVVFLFNCFNEHFFCVGAGRWNHTLRIKKNLYINLTSFEQQFIDTQYHMHYNVLC